MKALQKIFLLVSGSRPLKCRAGTVDYEHLKTRASDVKTKRNLFSGRNFGTQSGTWFTTKPGVCLLSDHRSPLEHEEEPGGCPGRGPWRLRPRGAAPPSPPAPFPPQTPGRSPAPRLPSALCLPARCSRSSQSNEQAPPAGYQPDAGTALLPPAEGFG